MESHKLFFSVRNVFRLLILVSICTLIFLGIHVATIWFRVFEIRNLEHKIRAKNIPTRLACLNIAHNWPSKCSSNNSLWSKAFEKPISPYDELLVKFWHGEYSPEQHLNPEIIDALSDYLNENGEALRILEKASERECCYRSTNNINVTDMEAEISRYHSWRDCSRLLSAATVYYAEKGGRGEAIKYMIANIELGRVVSYYPTFLAQATRESLIGFITIALERSLSRLNFDECRLKELQIQLESSLYCPLLKKVSLSAEISMGNELFFSKNLWQEARQLRDTDAHWWLYKITGRAHADQLLYLAAALQSIQLVDTPYPKRLYEVKRFQQKLPEHTRNTFSSHIVAARRDANLRSLIVALAVKRFYLSNDRYPVTLEELGDLCPEEFLIDPYTGNLLKYRVKETTYQVYSLGPDALGEDFEEPDEPHPHFLVEIAK